VNDLGLLLGCEYMTVVGEVVARSVNLARARVTRPSETCRSNQGFREPSPRRRTLVLSEAQSRSGESHSPKRGGAKALECCCGLAQARDLAVGREVVSLKRARTRLSELA